MGNDFCKETPVEESANKIKNQQVTGKGGAIDLPSDCKVRVCVVAYDYHGYGADATKLPRLNCVRDGVRFAKMAKDCGAEVREFYDRPDLNKKGSKAPVQSAGHPTKQVILDEMRRVLETMGDNDAFVFYFAGLGISRPREVEEGVEEMMVCTEPDGSQTYLTEEDVFHAIESYERSHILFITDTFHNSTMCDLSRPTLAGYPFVNLASLRDHRHLAVAPKGKEPMKDEPSTFTQTILETVESLVEVPVAPDGAPPQEDFSVVQVYNKILAAINTRYENQDAVTVDAGANGEAASPVSPGSRKEKQDFFFEYTTKFDPDTFRWPLVPPPGWLSTDPLLVEKKPAQALGMFACVG